MLQIALEDEKIPIWIIIGLFIGVIGLIALVVVVLVKTFRNNRLDQIEAIEGLKRDVSMEKSLENSHPVKNQD